MPSEPTREELLAQVAALQAELSRVPPKPAPQVVDAHKVALARALDPLVRQSKQTPEEIVSQITALKAVIISGVNSAGYGDKRTEFRSLTELRQILNDLEEDLADALGMGGRIRQIRMTTQADKGL